LRDSGFQKEANPGFSWANCHLLAAEFFRQSFCALPESISEGENPMPIDPVCKMEVNIADAAASHDYHAETLYFCSIDCLHKFERDPAVYMDDMGDEERIA
jgi:YHS domain-containing protein